MVAITGSYGKTSTKGYVAHLLRGSKTVVPTPKSYNNQSGLCRAVNEHLLPGTDVAHVALRDFGKNADDQLKAAVRAARELGAKALILDAHLGKVTALTFHPRRDELSTADDDGRVRIWSELVMTSGHRNSFHNAMNWMTNNVASAGRASGRIICR